jgi:predicted transcriptional regulator
MLHMKRVQIQFTDEMAAALQHLAAETDQPVTAIVRGAVERILAESERDRLWERALAAVGGFNSGLGDVAENHDKYLNEGPRW